MSRIGYTDKKRSRGRLGNHHNRAPAIRFVIVASLILATVFVACTRVPALEQGAVPAYMSLVSRSAYGVLHVLGMGVERRGHIIQSQEFVVAVAPVCGAMEVMAVFAAAVLAYPSTWRRKWKGLALGLVALYTINVLRIAGLFVIGARFPSQFSEVHFIHAQALMLIAAAGLFAIWVVRASNHENIAANQIRP